MSVRERVKPENTREHWAVILAGGSGTRLQPLTQRLFGEGIPGEGCPKQFCALLGGKTLGGKAFGDRTLLQHTQARIAPVIAPERTAYAVVRAHHPYYREQLAEVPSEHIFAQPANRGTTAGIAFALARIASLRPDAVLGFFPADHYFADEDAFADTLDRAYRLADQQDDSILLLGAAPEHAEVEYGWIQPMKPEPLGPEPMGPSGPGGAAHPGLSRVGRFWEKPSAELARTLLEAGCLWNTFIMLGHVQTFLAALKQSVPGIFRAFQPLMDCAPQHAEELAARAYSTLPSGDFSQQVLSAVPERLTVLRLENAGWSDLGTPERLMATWSRYGLSPSSLPVELATVACS